MLRTALAILALLNACHGDETLTAYGAADTVWELRSINQTDFTATATLVFPEEGRLTGTAPCNSFTGAQTVPYPWFKAENIAVTRTACPDLAAEQLYLETLAAMTISEVSGGTLILSNEDKTQMIFTAQ